MTAPGFGMSKIFRAVLLLAIPVCLDGTDNRLRPSPHPVANRVTSRTAVSAAVRYNGRVSCFGRFHCMLLQQL